MAYADLIDREGINSQYLCILKPRRLITSTDWANPSGTLFTQTFSLGEIMGLTDDGTQKTKATTSSLSDGDWYHDTDDNTLYFDDGVDPDLSDIVVTYDIYLGTFDAHFYQDPLDNTSRVVYYEPLITTSPSVEQGSTDDLFGFIPTLSSSISISNTTNFLQEHVYESSFNKTEIKVYHYLDELTVANTKLVINAFCSNVDFKEKVTTIQIFDNIDLFNEEFRHVDGMQFYASGTIAGLDPDFEGKPVRKVFGVAEKFIPVNIDFNSDAASGTNNRDWVCSNPHDNPANITAAVKSSPTSTTTKTYLDDATGLRVGDTVWLDFTAGTYYVDITVVETDAGDNYIEHAAVAAAGSSADEVKRFGVGSVSIVRNGFAPLKLLYGQDYTIYTDGTNKLYGFTLNDNFENSYNTSGEMFYNSGSNSTNLEVSDLVYCRIYGSTNQETIGGSPFGGNGEGGSLSSGVVITYSLLKNNIGLTEAEIDTVAFAAFLSGGILNDDIGFAIPSEGSKQFPIYKDILTEIFQSNFTRFLIDQDRLYSLKLTAPYSGSAVLDIDDTEIMKSSFQYIFDYKDLVSDIIVEYAPKEVTSKNQKGASYTKATSSSDLATRLHGVTKQKTFQSLHFNSVAADLHAARLRIILSERMGRIRFKAKSRFFNTELNDLITTSRTRQPGFSYDADTERDRSGVVVNASKTLTSIQIELDDQKGIQENQATWGGAL